MNKWLQKDRVNRLPRYASHQVGVCGESTVESKLTVTPIMHVVRLLGVVLREDTREILVTQDKYKVCVV